MSPLTIISLVFVFLFTLVLVINPKAHPKGLWKKQLSIFYNYKNSSKKKAIYWFDILSFFICPLGISTTFTFGFKFVLSKDSTSILLTIFSIFFSIIFSAFALISSIRSKSPIMKSISEETSIALFSESELSIIEILLLLIAYFLIDSKNLNAVISEWILRFITFFCLLFAFFCIALILIIVKRVFSLLLNQDDASD